MHFIYLKFSIAVTFNMLITSFTNYFMFDLYSKSGFVFFSSIEFIAPFRWVWGAITSTFTQKEEKLGMNNSSASDLLVDDGKSKSKDRKSKSTTTIDTETVTTHTSVLTAEQQGRDYEFFSDLLL